MPNQVAFISKTCSAGSGDRTGRDTKSKLKQKKIKSKQGGKRAAYLVPSSEPLPHVVERLLESAQ